MKSLQLTNLAPDAAPDEMIMDTTNFPVKRALFQNSDKEIASMKSEVKQNSNPKSVSIIHITEVANQENNHQHAKPTPMNIESNSESLSIESENEKENILTKEVTNNVNSNLQIFLFSILNFISLNF